MEEKKARVIAFYLPQYHPIPENDSWWGAGFSEWRNVSKAKPLFIGHKQPVIPGDLGFYDLRVVDTHAAQIELAKYAGINAFCYYHYWFNGKKILHEPLERKLKNEKEDFPFMLSWANENWTRAWDGLDREMLLKQEYSDADDAHHMEHLCDTFFNDKRYIKHEGKPVFLVYRPSLFPDIKKTISTWRNIAREKGIGELHLGYMQSWGFTAEPESLGFDFAVEFQPKFPVPIAVKKSLPERIIARLKRYFVSEKETVPADRHFDYHTFVKLQMQNQFTTNVSPCLVPMWDNSSRRKTNAFIS